MLALRRCLTVLLGGPAHLEEPHLLELPRPGARGLPHRVAQLAALRAPGLARRGRGPPQGHFGANVANAFQTDENEWTSWVFSSVRMVFAWCSPHVTSFLDAFPLFRPRKRPRFLQVTGHSLGGAVAVLGMVDLVDLGWTVHEAYTFGMPRAGDATFARAFDRLRLGLSKREGCWEVLRALLPGALGFEIYIYMKISYERIQAEHR